MVLHGRAREQAELTRLVSRAREGAGSNLVVLGEAGSGKSSLLHDAADGAGPGMRVVTVSGVESEAPLAFAALQRLLAPLMPYLDALPEPQAHALRVAFGQDSGDVGDRFLVFLGALSLVSAAAEDAPVLAVVDDAHWLDEASQAALMFVARRISSEPVALLWAARPEYGGFDPAALPQLRIGGLGLDGIAAIASEQAAAEISPEVAALLLANTDGNPLAVRELVSVLTAGQLAGDEALPARLPVTERIEQVFLARARRLSADAQLTVLVASADDSARLSTVAGASELLGADAGAVGEVERSGLVTVEECRIRLRHPLVRSALYGSASSAQLRRVHAALAEVLTRDEDADRRAWHRSSAVLGPDESVADELVAAARRAEQRGGHEAASAAWARAAELSGDQFKRGRYLFAAAMAAWIVAQPDRARVLVERAIQATSDPLVLADARRLMGRVEWNTRSVQAANRMLLSAAVEAQPHDSVRARELATEAVSIAAWGGESGADVDATTLVPSPATDAPARERTYDLMLRGFDRVVAGDYAGAVVPLRQAFEVHREVPEDYELLPNLSIGAMHLGEFDRSGEYLTRILARARSKGVLMMVLYASTRLAITDLVAGRWSDADSLATEAVTLGETTGHAILSDTPRAVLLLMAALRGEDKAFGELAPVLDEAMDRGTAGVLGVVLRDVVHWAHGVRQSATPASAFHRLAQMSHDVTRRMAAVDRIEMAVRAGQVEAARLWVEDMDGFAEATGQAWASAVASHGHAILADSTATADELFHGALEHHHAPGQAVRPFNLARTQLAYGEFLRRARRRVDARSHLRAALDGFESLRAAPWAERAVQELRASGETVRKRDADGSTVLTPQERQVAQLVQRGLSNKDVAAQLFVSPRTVDFHLRNVFTKTGVASRGELAGVSLD